MNHPRIQALFDTLHFEKSFQVTPPDDQAAPTYGRGPDRYAALAVGLLAKADIKIGGTRPWDIAVHDERFYRRAITGGSMGIGESFMDGWWDCAALDQMIERLLRTDVCSQVKLEPWMTADIVRENLPNLAYVWTTLRPFLARFRSYNAVAETHYNAGNDFYAALLDKRMMYTCAYWADAKTLDDTTLDEAQDAKLAMSCRKLDLEPGMRVLDIGCGWGGFAKYAAENFGVSVVGYTVSPEQRQRAIDVCRGLPVEIRLDDYRNITGRYDRCASFGMFEHVGRDNYATYMRVVHGSLADDGVFLLEAIGDNLSNSRCSAWFQKYIFTAPTSMYPSIKEISAAAEGLFTVEDWHNFGADYAPTLRAWADNLVANRDRIVARYGERFYRMYIFYLLSCAGSFAARLYQNWQVVLTKRGMAGGFRAR